MTKEVVPLRWCHFHEGPEGPGVYVHTADLLALFDVYGAARVQEELAALLEDRVASAGQKLRQYADRAGQEDDDG